MDPADPYLAQRRLMVENQIRSRGIHDERVLLAMEEIPRERFVPAESGSEAFSDRALPIDCRQTISQPFMVAAMTQCLHLDSSLRVLEIGTGSGYQTAILARLAGRVYTIERIAPLLESARERLAALGVFNVQYRLGDGTAGWPEEAPFDCILVTAGAPDIPPPLVDQLAEGGRLVIPVGNESDQTLTIADKQAGRVIEHPQFGCRFVKLLGREGWPPGSSSDPIL